MRLPLVSLLLTPAVALAYEPGPGLSEVAILRFESLSFFLLVFLVMVLAVRGLWSWLRRDLPRLPRLGFDEALVLVFVWGLTAQLAHSLIAGGRELMTPGAWDKKGATRELRPRAPPTNKELVLQARRQRLEELREALWEYAAEHEGEFPPSDFDLGVPEERWRVPGDTGMHFLYVSGRKADESVLPLAYEPGLFGPERWVLFTNRDIRWMSIASLHALLGRGTP